MALSPYYADLFDRLLQGKLSPEEAEELVSLLAADPPDPQVAELLQQRLLQPVPQQVGPEITAALEARLPAILSQTQPQPAPRIFFYKKPWFHYSAAAAIILFVVGAWVWMYSKEPARPISYQPPGKIKTHDTGSAKSIVLTLDDGRTVVLDSLPDGAIAKQSGTAVLLGKGNLAYNSGGAAGKLSYNTITIPRGRQFRVLLPDGSRVWLNAASSMRYPTAFTGSEREVEITGEAYFEVTKNASPFRVKIQGKPAAVEVLGTRFNVNAYGNEASISTTLLEGSVKISAGNDRVVIKPGQQAQVASRISVVNNTDVQKVMAWKEGVFNFQDAGLEEVMRQLERWYDIEVVYEKGIPPIEFVGKMGRDLSLQEVLRGLDMSEVHFSMQGRKLMVKP